MGNSGSSASLRACALRSCTSAYDDEPATIADLAEFIECQGLQSDIASADGLEPEAVLDALDCAGNVLQSASIMRSTSGIPVEPSLSHSKPLSANL